MSNKLPVLYIFVNTDLPSMNPGKAQAHSGHAANSFVYQNCIVPMRSGQQVDESVLEWMSATTQGFGTQINLKAPWEEVEYLVNRKVVPKSELVIDPTYPYIVDREVARLINICFHTIDPIDLGNGKFICHRKEATAAYLFGYKDELEPFVGKYPLHP